MIGLIMLLVVVVYMSLWVGVVALSYRLTFKATQSRKKSYAVSGIFFLVMYLIPFWDLLPTLVMHKYYCSTEAGFWTYKKPAQWIDENSEVVKLLKNYKKPKIDHSKNGWDIYHINDYISYEINLFTNVHYAISRKEQVLRDKYNDEVLARFIEFKFGAGMSSIHSGGSLDGWRRFFVFVWFDNRGCSTPKDSYESYFREIFNKYYAIGDRK